MTWILSFLISTSYSAICLGWGLLAFKIFSHHRINLNASKKFSNNLSILVASKFLTGVALISAILTVIGLTGNLRQLPLILVLLPGIFGLIINGKNFYNYKYVFINSIRAFFTMPLWLQLIGVFTIFLVVGTGIGAWILPPKGDAAAFYMVYPKIIAATGLLEPMQGPFYFFSVIGLPIELHYATLMILADDHAAKFFMFPIAISAGVILAGIIRQCDGKSTAVTLSWAMLFSSFTFHHYIYDGKVDLAAVAFGLASIYWLLHAMGSKLSILSFGLVGWFAGLATVAKFSYLLALSLSLLMLFIWLIVANHSERKEAGSGMVKLTKASLVMISTFLIAWFPQLLKNWILFDAPLAPFIGLQGDGNFLNQVWFSAEDTMNVS